MTLHWSEEDYQAHLRRQQDYQALYLGHREYGALVSEKAFQSALVKLARQHGFLAYHTFNAKRSPEGFPDLVLVHPTRPREISPVFLVELKTTRGQVTPAQQAWVEALDGRTTVSAIWRPHDLPMVTRWLRGEGGATTIDR